MRILITNHMLATRTGSELFTRDLALGLQRAGLEVAVYAPLLGPLSEDLRKAKIPVVDHPCRLPWAPDVIHGQHHLPTMVALCAFPVAPAFALIHGYHPWEEMALVHPRIRVYGAVAGRLKWWIARQTGRVEDEIRVVPNVIDGAKFRSPVPVKVGPVRQALLFSNYVSTEDTSWAVLREATARCGLTLEGLGAKFQNTSETPEEILRGTDVVFATGRSAIEAIACGCIVFPYRQGALGDRITAANYDEYHYVNFTVEHAVKPGTVEDLCAALKNLVREDPYALPGWVLRDFSVGPAVDQLVQIYRECIASVPDAREQPENTALTNYLAELAGTLRNDNARLERMRRGWAETKRKLARAKRERDELRRHLRSFPVRAGLVWRGVMRKFGL